MAVRVRATNRQLTTTRRPVAQDFKSSLDFNGTSSRVTIAPNPVALQVTTGTFAAWIKMKNLTANSGIICKSVGAAGYYLAYRNGGVRLEINSTVNSPLGVISRGEWVHVAGTFNGTANSIYVNGQLSGTTTVASTTITDSNTTLAVGSYSSPFDYFPGNIVNARVLNRGLTATEVMDLYSSGIVPTGTTALALNLQEGAGTTALDTSGNNNNGTITAATYSADVPSVQRQLVGGNMVKNGGFEYAPPSGANVATTSTTVFVDGTTGGSNTNKLFGMGVLQYATGASAMFDYTERKSGICSFKISTTSTVGRVGGIIGNVADDGLRLPSTFSNNPIIVNQGVHNLSLWVKTLNAAANSGIIVYHVYNQAGTRISANNVLTQTFSGTNDWTYVQQNITFPANSYYCVISVRLNAAGNVSDLWFDDVTLTPTVNTTRAIA